MNENKDFYRSSMIYGTIISILLIDLNYGSVKNFVFSLAKYINASAFHIIANAITAIILLLLMSYVIGVTLSCIALFVNKYLEQHFTKVPILIQLFVLSIIILGIFTFLQSVY